MIYQIRKKTYRTYFIILQNRTHFNIQCCFLICTLLQFFKRCGVYSVSICIKLSKCLTSTHPLHYNCAMNRYLGAYQFDAACLSEELFVESAGCYNISEADHHIQRTHGTNGYFLVYVHRGTATVGGDRPFEISDGGFLLYPPGSAQDITYRAAENTAYYWLSFGGSGVQAFLCSLGLTQFCCFAEKTKETAGIFQEILSELQYHRAGYTVLCRAHLMRLLVSLSRARLDFRQRKNDQSKEQFRAAIDMMHTAGIHTPIETLASLCFMSKYQFIHSFSRVMGISPHNYQSRIVLRRAQELLSDSSLSVTDIAQKLGFSDVYYFSRFFKKYTGVSPLSYRKRLL